MGWVGLGCRNDGLGWFGLRKLDPRPCLVVTTAQCPSTSYWLVKWWSRWRIRSGTCREIACFKDSALTQCGPVLPLCIYTIVWLNGLVVSALEIRTRGPGFNSPVVPLFRWVATLGKLFTHIVSPVSQLQGTGLQKGSFWRLCD